MKKWFKTVFCKYLALCESRDQDLNRTLLPSGFNPPDDYKEAARIQQLRGGTMANQLYLCLGYTILTKTKSKTYEFLVILKNRFMMVRNLTPLSILK